MTTAITTESERMGATSTASQAAGVGVGTILSGGDAVNAAERLLCGSAAVLEPARAEGFALAGLPAASLYGAGGATSAAAPYVSHRSRLSPPSQPFGAFELVAESVQQAVDHSAVAHRLVSGLGTAGACVLPAPLASELSFVRMPKGAAVRAELDGDAPESLIAKVFEATAKELGRPCRPFTGLHVDGADHLIVATGPAAPVARRLVDLLRGRAVSCGVISVALVRPLLPALAELLRMRTSVIVIDDPADEAGLLLSEVRAALKDATVPVIGVPYVPGAEAELIARVAGALGTEINGDAGGLRLGPPPVPARSLFVGAAPADRWSDELLRGALSWVGDRVSVARPEKAVPGAVVLSVARVGLRPGPLERLDGLDVLFVSHPRLLFPALVSRLRQGGTLLIQSSAVDAQALWAELGPARVKAIADHGVRVMWLDARRADGTFDGDFEPRLLLQGGILGVFEALDTVLPVGQGSRVPQGAGTDLLRLGAAAVHEAGAPPASLPASAQPLHTVPRLQAAPVDGPDLAWRDAIRQFHVTGQGGWTGADPLPTLPLMPLLLGSLIGAAPRELPLVLTGSGAGPVAQPLRQVIADAVAAYEAVGGASVAVGPNIDRLLRVAARALGSGAPMPLAEVMEGALASFVADFQVSAEAAQALNAETAHIKSSLPAGARAVGLGRHAVLALHAAATAQVRTRAVDLVTAEVRDLLHKLRDLLRVDDVKAPSGRSESALVAGVGASGQDLFDASALADTLRPRRGPTQMTPERRNRVEETIAQLDAWLGRRRKQAVLLHSGLLSGVTMPDFEIVAHPNPLEAAIGAFDGASSQVAALLRAVRRARLEAAGRYDAALHDAPIGRLSWESFTPDELRLVPPVLVVQEAAAVWRGLASFSNLLRSGRPVQIIALEGAMGWGADAAAGLAPEHFGIGYLAVAHRDVFVLQGTLARPVHLAAGLSRMAKSTRPAIALVAEPAWGGAVPESVQLEAAFQGRGTPCFVHDPAAGPTWAERFDLSENPAANAAWATGGADVVGADGAPTRAEGAFTFAHAAALDPDARSHLRIIPPTAWGDEQIQVAAWLESGDDGAPRVPYIDVVDEEGVVRRAVISRDLAWAARNRAQFWRVLQELAGTNNEHAVRAAAAARVTANDEAEERLAAAAAQHAVDLQQARAETAREALEKVARVLLDLDLAAPAVAAATAPAAPKVAAPVKAAAVAEAAPAPAVVVEEEEESFDEAYIDTMLCTTCNECINLNGRMFKYNADKQAVLADVTAGTYAQLVTAAEKCTARCIHPGKPRKGDDSATADVLARAAAL